MRVEILGLFCLFALSGAQRHQLGIINHLEELETSILEIFPQDLIKDLIFLDNVTVASDGDVRVVINQYADQVFQNLQNFIRTHNLNTVDIPDAHLSLDHAGHCDLTSGRLEDLDTLSRNEDVELIYEPENRKVILVLPIKFGDLQVYYHYHTKVLFISISGDVHGSVQDTKVNAVLSFSFDTYHASLDHYDMKDSGKVSVHFSGNPIVDWLSNSMAAVVSEFLGQVVVNVIAKLIRDNLRDFVDTFNQTIDKIINH